MSTACAVGVDLFNISLARDAQAGGGGRFNSVSSHLVEAHPLKLLVLT